MGYIKVCTGDIIEDKYPLSMANGVHFSYSRDGQTFQKLHQGYGILYPEANIREDNTLEERGAVEPMLTREGDTYIILAKLVDKEGKPVEETNRVYWKTADFVEFTAPHKISAEEARNKWYSFCESIEIPEQLEEAILRRWVPLRGVSAGVRGNLEDGTVRLECPEDLQRVKAEVTFTDGSISEYAVDWDEKNLIPLGACRYRVNGRVLADDTGFPLAVGYADPVVFQWRNHWYFLATNDNVDDIGMFVREADTVEELFEEKTKEYCILEYDESRGFCQTFWAPEFHVIGGELYILFAVSGTQWGPQCHMMRLKKGGSIINPKDWEEPVRVLRKNGDYLNQNGITLDMTYFKAGEVSYVCWSERYQIGTELDSGSMIYIAAIDEREPWKLTSEPVLLSRPLYGWENNSGTINNEGPYALILKDKVYLAYSGGAACGYSYAIGYLIADAKDNLLDVNKWKKFPAPVFHSGSVEGIQGPGHNSFFYDEEGRLMIAYHGQEREKYYKRCSAIHPVHIAKDGFPLLNVAGEAVLPEGMREITAIIELRR